MNTTRPTRPGSKIVQRHIPCPVCPSSDGYCLYDDGHGYCFSCKYLYLPNKKQEDNLEYTYEYLPWREVTKETMTFYDVKTKIDTDGKPIEIGYKYPNGEFKIRDLSKKDFRTKKDHPPVGLFGRDKFSAGQSRFVTITEGELDALSLHQVLGEYPVVSVQSSSSAKRDCTVDYDWLNSFERIYLAFDGDQAGREAVRSVASLFDYHKVFVVRFTRHKDANACLVAGEAEQLKKVWWNSKQYLPEDIVSDFSEFETILDNPKKIGLPYPFKILNDFTYGIRTGETVLITAQEKVGKTELMHFIEHQILKETNDNVGSIFLEEPPQRHLQALAGIEMRVPIHLPQTDRPRDEIIGALKNVVKVDGRLHVYSHFGSDDPGDFLDLVRFLVTARGCRYVLVDHISMVVSGILGGNDERKLIDYLSTRLEMMVKQLDFALIMVSHVNDLGQTRGSRWLTKVCDLQINATRDMMSESAVERNTIRLAIPISRYPGITGNVGSLIFDRDTYTFKEEAANDREPQAMESKEVVRGEPYSRAA